MHRKVPRVALPGDGEDQRLFRIDAPPDSGA